MGSGQQNKSAKHTNSLLVSEDAKEGEGGTGLKEAFLREHQPRAKVAGTVPRFADREMICYIRSDVVLPRKAEGAASSADDMRPLLRCCEVQQALSWTGSSPVVFGGVIFTGLWDHRLLLALHGTATHQVENWGVGVELAEYFANTPKLKKRLRVFGGQVQLQPGKAHTTSDVLGSGFLAIKQECGSFHILRDFFSSVPWSPELRSLEKCADQIPLLANL